MAKFKSPVTFKGVEENKVFEANEPFEMTVKRAEEVAKNVQDKYGIDLKMERLDAPDDENPKAKADDKLKAKKDAAKDSEGGK